MAKGKTFSVIDPVQSIDRSVPIGDFSFPFTVHIIITFYAVSLTIKSAQFF